MRLRRWASGISSASFVATASSVSAAPLIAPASSVRFEPWSARTGLFKLLVSSGPPFSVRWMPSIAWPRSVCEPTAASSRRFSRISGRRIRNASSSVT